MVEDEPVAVNEPVEHNGVLSYIQFPAYEQLESRKIDWTGRSSWMTTVIIRIDTCGIVLRGEFERINVSNFSYNRDSVIC